MQKISIRQFYNCISLRHFLIPENIKFIDTDAFLGCQNLIISFDNDYHSNFLIDYNCLIEKHSGKLIFVMGKIQVLFLNVSLIDKQILRTENPNENKIKSYGINVLIVPESVIFTHIDGVIHDDYIDYFNVGFYPFFPLSKGNLFQIRIWYLERKLPVINFRNAFYYGDKRDDFWPARECDSSVSELISGSKYDAEEEAYAFVYDHITRYIQAK